MKIKKLHIAWSTVDPVTDVDLKCALEIEVTQTNITTDYKQAIAAVRELLIAEGAQYDLQVLEAIED